MKLTINQRKMVVFVFSVLVLIATSFFMELDYYKVFAQNLFYIAAGFFAGNSLEHMSGAFKKS